jgi:muramidase (phage lysozyme)
MNPEEQKKQKAQDFISQSSILKPGKKISVKVNRISGIIPKRSIPTDVATKITPKDSESLVTSGQGSDAESVASPSRKVVSSLGRLTLDLVQINDNLDAIKDVIAEDYLQAKETNKREIEDYRKRIANRHKTLPKKDLGDDKNSLKDIIKPFVGSFFSGVGGAIRALAAFNLLDALLNGDYMKVFKSLMGIGITFIPQIGTMIAGAILKSLLKGFGRGMMRGAGGGGRMSMGRPARMRGSPGIGKFGAMMALGTGALALGSAFASTQDNGDSQTRLEDLTAEQKALTDEGLVSITQTDLKKFQDLNKKFEKTLDILIKKSGSGISTDMTDKSYENTAPGTAPMSADIGQVTSAVEDPNVKAFLDTLANVESGGKYNVSVGGATFSDMSRHPEMYNPELGSDAAGRYQFISTTFKPIAERLGLKDFSPRSQDLAAVQYLKDLGVLDEIMTGDKQKIEDVIRRLRGSKWTGLRRYGEGQGFEFFQRRKQTYGSQSSVAPTPSRRNADEVSASPTSRGVLVSLVPTPAGSNSPGSANNNGSSGNDYVDPSNREDTVGMLYRTQMNIMEVG